MTRFQIDSRPPPKGFYAITARQFAFEIWNAEIAIDVVVKSICSHFQGQPFAGGALQQIDATK